MSIANNKDRFNNIVSLLSDHVFLYYSISENSKIIQYEPDEVIKASNRFDVFAKLAYIDAYLNRVNSSFFKELYLEHIQVFNGFFENDGTGKDTPQKFLDTLNNLIRSAINLNYNFSNTLIPLDQFGCLVDCAHRLALHMAYQENVQTIKLAPLKDSNSFCYNYDFFRKRGLQTCYSDYIAWQYIRYFEKARIILLFPSSQISKYDEIINSSFSVFYKKEFSLTKRGQLNFVKQLYMGEEWLDSIENAYTGAEYKRSKCFQIKGTLVAYLVNSCNDDDVTYVKELIRKKACKGNHSVHSTDCHKTTKNLGSIIFNDNSIEALNNKRDANFTKFDRLLEKYARCLSRDNIQSDNYCVSGSSVLSFYGIRECYDLDYLCCGDDSLKTDDSLISSHNLHIENFIRSTEIISIDDIVFNPKNHFFYSGMKFMTLNSILRIKQNRNEPKDVKDIALIEKHFNSIINSG